MALKILKPGFSPERSQREIDAMTRCCHPNVARLLGIFDFDYGGTKYIFLLEEFFDGGTFKERIQKSGLLGRDALLDVGERLIGAMAHVAGQELVHRDLKAENVMFRNGGGEPVIVDFGLVRDLRRTSLTDTWVLRGPGTPLYAPPEQLNNEKDLIDWRSDQFSLAVMLSYAGFGFHPYAETASSPTEVIERVAKREKPSARFVDVVSRARLPVLQPMVAPWPVQRVRTPAELLDLWIKQREASA